MHTIASVWPRFRPLAWLAVVFVGISTLTRLALLIATGDGIPVSPGYWLYAFVVGFGYDVLTFVYFAWPLVLLLWLMPRRWHAARFGRVALATLCFVLVFVLLFVAGAEWTFWDEFQTRFNFIAVDYLIYTNEVIGNIRESYPVRSIVAGILLATALLMLLGRRWRRAGDDRSSLGARSRVALGWLLATVLVTFAVDGNLKQRTANEYVNQLAGNGIYEFFAAVRSSELSYPRFYPTLPQATAFANLRRLLQTPDAHFVSDDPLDITRDITSDGGAGRDERRLNVVLISIESLSAFYSGAYGGNPSLTPELDRLAGESLLFTAPVRLRYAHRARTRSPCPVGAADARRVHRQAAAQRGHVQHGDRVQQQGLRVGIPLRRLRRLRQHESLLRQQRLRGPRSQRHRGGEHPSGEYLGRGGRGSLHPRAR